MSSSFIADPDKLLPPPVVRWGGLGDDADLLAVAKARHLAFVKQQHNIFRRNYDLGIIPQKFHRTITPELEVTVQRIEDQEIITAFVTEQGKKELESFYNIVAIEFTWPAWYEGDAVVAFRKHSTTGYWDEFMFKRLWYVGGGNKQVFIFNLVELAKVGVALPLETVFFPSYSNFPYFYGEGPLYPMSGVVDGDAVEYHEGFIADRVGDPAAPATQTEPPQTTYYTNLLTSLNIWSGGIGYYADNTPQTIVNNLFSGSTYMGWRLESAMDAQIAVSSAGQTTSHTDHILYVSAWSPGTYWLGRPHDVTLTVTRVTKTLLNYFSYLYQEYEWGPLPYKVKSLPLSRWDDIVAAMTAVYGDYDAEFDTAYNALGWATVSEGSIDMGDPKYTYPVGDEGFVAYTSPGRYVVSAFEVIGQDVTVEFLVDFGGAKKGVETKYPVPYPNPTFAPWPPDGWDE